MSAYKGSTGSAMNFSHACRHHWGPWEVGREQRWKECTKCGQVEGGYLEGSGGPYPNGGRQPDDE